jgi:hypothetical protein
LIKGDIIDFYDFESNARDIPVTSAHSTADAFDDDFVVFIDESDGMVARGKRSDLSTVLDKLDFDAFSDSGVGLFCLDADFFNHDASCLGYASEGM